MISNQTADELIESFKRVNADKVVKRDRYWRMLRAANAEYNSLVNGTEYDDGRNGLYYFLQHNYGVKPGMVDGNFTDEYTVTDEKKFMMFQLKYSDV